MSKKKLKTLIIAACASELGPFANLNQKHYCIKKKTGFLAAGIGPVAASFGLTHFLEDYQPEKILAIGTAGIINKAKFKIGEIVLAKTVATESFFEGVYTPAKQPHQEAMDTGLPKGWEGEATVYSPQEITKDETHRKILEKKYDVEHLESFAFAFVAKKFNIPIQIILGLTNFTDENAHRDWKENQEKVMKKIYKNLNSTMIF